jgi:hypothetical protein
MEIDFSRTRRKGNAGEGCISLKSILFSKEVWELECKLLSKLCTTVNTMEYRALLKLKGNGSFVVIGKVQQQNCKIMFYYNVLVIPRWSNERLFALIHFPNC